MMKSTLVFVFAIVGGVYTCPSDYEMQLGGCMGPLSSAMSGGAPDCGMINNALQCLRSIQQQCVGNARVEAMFQALPLQNLEAMCTVGPGGCPPITQLSQQLQTCVTLYSGTGSCSSMRDGMSCLEELQDKCAQDPTSAQFFTAMPELQRAYQATCSRPQCAVDDPARALRKCSRRMTSSRTTQKSPEKRCRILVKGIDCIMNLFDQCPSLPAGGMTQASMMQQRRDLVEYCRGKEYYMDDNFFVHRMRPFVNLCRNVAYNEPKEVVIPMFLCIIVIPTSKMPLKEVKISGINVPA